MTTNEALIDLLALHFKRQEALLKRILDACIGLDAPTPQELADQAEEGQT